MALVSSVDVAVNVVEDATLAEYDIEECWIATSKVEMSSPSVKITVALSVPV